MSFADAFKNRKKTDSSDGWTTVSTRPKLILSATTIKSDISGNRDISGAYIAPALRPPPVKSFDEEFPTLGGAPVVKKVVANENASRKFTDLIKGHIEKDAEDKRLSDEAKAAKEQEVFDSRVLDGIPSLSRYLQRRKIHEEEERRRRRRIFDSPPDSEGEDDSTYAEPEPELASHSGDTEEGSEEAGVEAYDADEFDRHH
jgi:hypothetical protein